MTEQLCASCKSGPEKKCFFKEIVDNIVNSVPPKKQQTPICKGSKATLEAE
ncbi:MAG: hypothetical protein HY424_01920, partial [Candidatus Levybacteria bacterium]|nr:hypothetical protein [Candidatus Levybacteria bacterium]